MMALEGGGRDVEAKEGTTHSSECERRERGQHYQETGREGPGAVRLVVGWAVWVVRIVWIPFYDLVEVEAVVVIVGIWTPIFRADHDLLGALHVDVRWHRDKGHEIGTRDVEQFYRRLLL